MTRHPDVISIKIELPASAQPEDFARVHDVAVRAVQAALLGILPIGSQIEHAIQRPPLVYSLTRHEPEPDGLVFSEPWPDPFQGCSESGY